MSRLIKPVFEYEDERGVLREITRDPVWRQLNQQDRVKGSIVGNHYHKKMRELFYMIDGKILVKLQNIQTNIKEELIVKKGDIFIINPFEAHALCMLENSSFLVLLSEKFDDTNKDIHPFVIE